MNVSPNELKLIKAILQCYVPEETVWAFGSRVHGRHIKPFSDLDLAIITDNPLDSTTYQDLMDAFSESDLPFKVDIIDWSRIKPEFRTIIQKEYEIVLGTGLLK
jgi:predicted nucleotidyltransferase